MAKTVISTLKDWFRTGKYPTQSQFWNWMDSYWHKDEAIPLGSIVTLTAVLNNKANVDALAAKADLGADGKVPAAQLPTGGGSSVMRFPKDPSLTAAHIGLLAMQKVTTLVPNPETISDFEIKAVLANTVPKKEASPARFKLRFKNFIIDSNSGSDADNPGLQFMQAIRPLINDNTEIPAIWVRYWGTNNTNLTFITWYDLLNSDYGQYNGNGNEMPDAATALLGITQALGLDPVNNASNDWLRRLNEGAWATDFNVVSPLAEVSAGVFEITIETKTVPNTRDSYFQIQFENPSPLPDSPQIEVVIEEAGNVVIPEMVPYTILGKIVGVEGNEVLIDTSSIFEVKLASAADGELGTIPFTPEIDMGDFYPVVLAWRNGRAISIYGYSLINGIFDNDLQEALTHTQQKGGMFRVLNGGMPDDVIKVSK